MTRSAVELDLDPANPFALRFLSGYTYVVRVFNGDPWRGWNQRLRLDERINVLAGSDATFQTFREQFEVDEDYATEWFRTNNLNEYLPRDAGGILGRLGRKEHPVVPHNTQRIIRNPLRPNIHALTPQQIVDQLILSIRHAHASDQLHLSIPRYFKGTGRGQDPHVNIGTGMRRGASMGVDLPVDNVTMRLRRERIPVRRVEIPVNIIGMDEIQFYSDVEEREVGTPNKSIYVHNVTFRRFVPRGENARASHSARLLTVQFESYDLATRFAEFARNPGGLLN